MILRAPLMIFAVLAAIALPGPWAGNEARFAHAQQPAAPDPGNLDERLARMEERIRDMQSVIATLQSFVGSGVAASAPGGSPAGASGPAAPSAAPNELSIRVLALETQIRALTDRMKQINERVDQGGAPAAPVQGAVPDAAGDLPPWHQGAASPPQGAGVSGAPQPQKPDSGARFSNDVPSTSFFGSGGEPRQTAKLPPLPGLAGDGGSARGIYDDSYEKFLRNDLDGAEDGFRSFVTTFPDDPLASNAYYWLGRTHFERKQFEPAAKAFLAGYKKNKKSDIAPDSLLHLGISLAQLGEKDAACSTLSAIGKQFPEAPGKLIKDADVARKRARC